MRRFFYPITGALAVGKTLEISDDNYQHWCKVLRAKVGDRAVFFDGTGGEYTATLSDINKKTALISISDFNAINRTNPYQTTLLQAVSGNDKMDYSVQKACEMGVSRIQPIITARSEQLKYERELKKITHWQKIAISACEQCGLNIVPEILPPISLLQALTNCQDTLKIVMSPTSDQPFRPQAPLPSTISLLVGAEGGLSDDEIALCRQFGFLTWSIGERVLRTETAGVVGLASLASFYDYFAN